MGIIARIRPFSWNKMRMRVTDAGKRSLFVSPRIDAGVKTFLY